jgi:hypothetical protein
MTPMGELCAQFTRRLREHGLAVREAASPAAIQEFESKYGVQLPLDMMHFFHHTNGMLEDELDPVSHVRVWPVEELRSLSEELPDYSRQLENPERAYVFADHLYWSLGYVVWLSPTLVHETPVFLVGDGPPVKVAESFAEFLNMYVDEPSRLLPPKEVAKDPHQGW